MCSKLDVIEISCRSYKQPGIKTQNLSGTDMLPPVNAAMILPRRISANCCHVAHRRAVTTSQTDQTFHRIDELLGTVFPKSWTVSYDSKKPPCLDRSCKRKELSFL